MTLYRSHTGDHKIALDAGDRLSKISKNGSLLAMKAYSLGQCGEEQSARELVDYILKFNREGVIHSTVVPAFVSLGRPRVALSFLEQAHRQRCVGAPRPDRS